MKTSVDFNQLINKYIENENIKTFGSAVNLSTFPATATQLITRSVILASLSNLFVTALLFYFSTSWTIIILGMIVSIISTVALAITISLKQVSHAFLEEIQNILLGLINPIEKIYRIYQKSDLVNLSKEDFAKKFLKENMIPKLFQKTKSFPFKSKLEKIVIKLVEGIDIKKIGEDSTSFQESVSKPIIGNKDIVDPVFFNKMKLSIESNIVKLKTYGNYPLGVSRKVVAASWSLIWIFVFVFGQY